jgi:hypothetical protein
MTVLHRRPGIASAGTLATITLALAVAHTVAPAWACEAGLDVWNLPDLQATESAERVRHEQVARSHDLLNRQIAASEAITAALIEGELSLADATDELARVNQHRVGFHAILPLLYPEASTFRARVARYAIDRVHEQLASDPTREAAVLARLESEYAAMTASY